MAVYEEITLGKEGVRLFPQWAQGDALAGLRLLKLGQVQNGRGDVRSHDNELVDTPVMDGGGSKLSIKSSGDREGFVFINGLTYSQKETHIHHTKSSLELVRFNGAELSWKVHNCDYFQFSYDPAVKCTRFLVSGQGEPRLVSYREIR